ncbi:hypothetical protein BLW93_07130 [Desulfurobacterium indicum]|uniref:Uncharacterized protein n=1 Tax=Desulfurobacterium indicum TaxID=1914305 RepID=A0A1R1MJZ8_9BACT|nr:hypothetical protein BLW93_07130 [Desulfurobacterium indicum]
MVKKVFLLFSGGLDSIIAARLLKLRGFEVEAVHFKTPFFGKEEGELKELADRIGVELKVFDITDEFLPILKNPPHGYGKNANPCIDCKALMLKKLKEIAGGGIIATGEVVGQRPMSQRAQALRLIEKIAGLEGRVLRPLSGKLLPPTVYEENGFIKRDWLLNLQGRSRKRYPEIVKSLGIDADLPTPAGGCLLTQPAFAKKVKDLIKHGHLTKEDIVLLKIGRHFRLFDGKLVVGRNREENLFLKNFAKGEDILFYTVDVPGPAAILRHSFSPEDVELASRIVAGYSDGKNRDAVLVAVERNGKREEIKIEPLLNFDSYRVT